MVDELQSSQLQLQDLHTYPTLPVSMVGLVQSQVRYIVRLQFLLGWDVLVFS